MRFCGALNLFKDAATTAVTFTELQLPAAVHAPVSHACDTGLQLRKVMGINTKVDAALYNEIIAGEYAGLAAEAFVVPRE